MDIRALSTISQRLAEAHQANMEASNPIPEYLKEFTFVFSKQSFDTLLEPKEWDHAVELIPGSKPTGCKIYPLSPTEQKELDIFLKENLEMGRIRPSKSPISSPVFFIKKKDSVRGRSYELSTWYSTLIPYLDLTLSYSPIAPPMLAYLCLVLILMFYWCSTMFSDVLLDCLYMLIVTIVTGSSWQPSRYKGSGWWL